MDLILKYFPDLSNTQKDRFEQLFDVYKFWNEQINVVSRKDFDALYEKHVLHSLAIAKYTKFKPQTKILDVGTGGGFPGIPLAILFEDSQFTLIDSIQKKIKVVKAVSEALELKNVTPVVGRAENINDSFDFIVSRAVTAFPKFVDLTKKKIKRKGISYINNGIIYLKGGDFSKEIKQFKGLKTTDISLYFTEEFFETKKIIYLPIEKIK